ncbi:MAG: amidohydrolase family protein [Gemmatimonadota bacterium]|nr:amidohydrolase family protein [Gemmatimonadota bacterium]
MAERLDRGYRAFPECRERISRLPSTYLRECYYDTVNFDPRALKLAADFAGAGHILAGSDYLHAIGSIAGMKESLTELPVSSAERQRILGENAEELLGVGLRRRGMGRRIEIGFAQSRFGALNGRDDG